MNISYEQDLLRSYQEAVAGSKRRQCEPTTQTEIDAHIRNGAWDIVPLEDGMRIIGTKWMFAHKKIRSARLFGTKRESWCWVTGRVRCKLLRDVLAGGKYELHPSISGDLHRVGGYRALVRRGHGVPECHVERGHGRGAS